MFSPKAGKKVGGAAVKDKQNTNRRCWSLVQRGYASGLHKTKYKQEVLVFGSARLRFRITLGLLLKVIVLG